MRLAHYDLIISPSSQCVSCGVEANMGKLENHLDDCADAALRPLAWIIIFVIGCVSSFLLLTDYNVF